METDDTDQERIAALEGRIVALEETLAGYRGMEALLEETQARLRGVLDTTREIVAVSVRGVVVEVNERFATLLGYPMSECIGKTVIEFHAPEVRELVAANIKANYDKPYEVTMMRKDGSRFFAEVHGRVIVFQGEPARLTVIREITERKQAEEALRAALIQEEVIRAQQTMLAELSTPLLPIADEVLLLPLVGAVNAERAAQVVQALVEGVAKTRAHTAILDITGVNDVDAQVADALLRAARAVKLLGARVVLTGIRPEVAQRFVVLGTDLGGITTYGTLQSGVAYALKASGASRR